VDPLFEFALSIKAIHRELERQANETMRSLGLTGPQADALIVIAQAGPLALKELGDLLIAEGGHPSRLVDRLVEAGFVERRAAGDDRRRVELSLTASGRRLAKRVTAARAGILELGRALIDPRELEPTLELLRRLVAQTQFAGLVERRRELLERNPDAPEAGAPAAGARRA
jgi:DNA-binding MarR family transcriptional regulator